jgi:hypothetical protein
MKLANALCRYGELAASSEFAVLAEPEGRKGVHRFVQA